MGVWTLQVFLRYLLSYNFLSIKRLKVSKLGGRLVCEMCGPELQSLQKSDEENDDTEQGEEDGGVQGKYNAQMRFEFWNLFQRSSKMDIGWTGKTFLKSPVKQQELFKHDLVPFLVGQASKARRENATEY